MKRAIERVYVGCMALSCLVAANMYGAEVGAPGLRYNDTASVPRGFYWYWPGAVRRGDLVQACLPERSARFAIAQHIILRVTRGACPFSAEPIVKVLAALPGDRVTVTPGAVYVNHHAWPVSAMRTFDSRGQHIRSHMAFGTTTIASGRVFLLGLHPRSWDSKYFGPLQASAVTGRWIPLHTEKGYS